MPPEEFSPISPWFNLVLAIALLIANGFFVAAEFALVKVRVGRVEQMVAAKRFFSKTALWLAIRLEKALSACQLGITMASLALGWVGEPAFAALLTPVLRAMGVSSEAAIHTIAFIVGFTTITGLHLVVGEQAPKIFAIRRPELMLLWCSVPLKMFYVLTYPLMAALNAATAWLLTLVGLKGAGEHEVPYTEEEIRALLREAHIHGNLTRSEHRLLDAVFEFDDIICRRIMCARGEIEFVDINDPPRQVIQMLRRTMHTRYPVCDGSLDDVLGVLHVKDLIGREIDDEFSFKTIMRPPKKVPENMPISKLLRHFQGTHQLMAFVLDEYGTVIGIVTLENVLEEIIGNVADEFDVEGPDIVPDGPGAYIIDGSAAVDDVERKLGLSFGETDVDTMAGLMMHYAERMVNAGDVIEMDGIGEAKVLEVLDDRTTRLRLSLRNPKDDAA
jgi:CBS domain containing-hemolysin-like protein